MSDRGWFEGAWGGDFAAGDFHRTDVVAGTGGRLDREGPLFVSSGTTRDRLAISEGNRDVVVSNSLALTLTATRDRLDPHYPYHLKDFHSIYQGIRVYRGEVHTLAADRRVRLLYFFNLELREDRQRVVDKPHGNRRFRSYDEYAGFLIGSVAAIRSNAADPSRRTPLRIMGTCSSGYDSPACLAISLESGLTRALVFDEDQRGASDAGSEFARLLGSQPLLVPRSAYRACAADEMAPVVAADGTGDSLHFLAAQELLADSVLITGFSGDGIWEVQTELQQLGAFHSGDVSGLSLTELRLRAGFGHLPLPMLGARAAADVRRISLSPEMAPWRVGGAYDRPIPRRVLEERGIPRGAFAIHKTATSVLPVELPPELLEEERRYARELGAGNLRLQRVERWAFRTYWYRGRDPKRRALRRVLRGVAHRQFGGRPLPVAAISADLGDGPLPGATGLGARRDGGVGGPVTRISRLRG